MRSRLWPKALCLLLLACGESETEPSVPEQGESSGEAADDPSGPSDISSSTGGGTGADADADADADAGGDPTAEDTNAGTEESGDEGGTGAAETSGAGGSTGDPPTSGPGVLPGETGLDAFCRRYIECGGTYYGDFDACMDASLSYWGECASRRAALDDFGACMADVACEDYNPDAYNPSTTVCSDQWSDLQASDPC